MLWFSQRLTRLHIVGAGEPVSQHKGKPAGFRTAPFGKTPAAEDFNLRQRSFFLILYIVRFSRYHAMQVAEHQIIKSKKVV